MTHSPTWLVSVPQPNAELVAARRPLLALSLTLIALVVTSASGVEAAAICGESKQTPGEGQTRAAPNSQKQIAVSYIDAHLESKALVAARIAVALFPDDLEAKAILGKALLRNGDYAEGVDLAGSLPDAYRNQLGLESALRAGRLVIEADSWIRKASDERPSAELNTAAGLLEQAASADPANTAIRKALGWLYLEKLDDPTKAKVHLQLLLKVKPDDLGSRKLLALASSRSGQLDDAIRLCRDVLAVDPGDRWIQVNLARALAWTREFDEAEAIYRRLIVSDPDDLQARIGLIEVLAWRGDTSRAFDDARALATNTRAPAAISLIGDLYRWNWQMNLARQQYESALALDPKLSSARDGIRDISRTRALRLEPKGYVFGDVDGYVRTMAGLAGRVPVSERGFLTFDLDQWWFQIEKAISIPRTDAGAGFEYHWNRQLETHLSATIRNQSAQGTSASATVTAKWSPSQPTVLYLSYAQGIPVVDSIATVLGNMSQNSSAVGLDLAVGSHFSVQGGASISAYSDSNRRWELMSQVSYLASRTTELSARVQFNTLKFAEYRRTYFTPDGFSILRLVVEARPKLGRYAALTLKAELPYVFTEGRFGSGFTVGMMVPAPNRIRAEFVYFRHYVPGDTSMWSGDGVQASVSVGF